MRILLDTHAFLWFVWDDPRLSAVARQAIRNGSNDAQVSVASAWEVAIKVGIGKLALATTLERFLSDQLDLNDLGLLSITLPHVIRVGALPLHHRDPFDRMLVAQSIEEGIPLVSADPI